MDWDNYRAFLEVYRSGDLGHAAHGLEMSVPTVRRRLDAVELQIGFPLFERTPRGLSPTPVARRLVHSIAAMDDFAAVAGTLKEGPVQTITVSIDEALAYSIADTTWADLRQSYPSLAVSVLTRPTHREVREAKADVAISHVGPGAGQPARSPGAFDVGLFAHRDYVSRAGVPEDVADLQRFCMVTAELGEANTWMEARLDLPDGSMRGALRTDSYVAQMAAIKGSVGIESATLASPGVARSSCGFCPTWPEAWIAGCGRRGRNPEAGSPARLSILWWRRSPSRSVPPRMFRRRVSRSHARRRRR